MAGVPRSRRHSVHQGCSFEAGQAGIGLTGLAGKWGCHRSAEAGRAGGHRVMNAAGLSAQPHTPCASVHKVAVEDEAAALRGRARLAEAASWVGWEGGADWGWVGHRACRRRTHGCLVCSTTTQHRAIASPSHRSHMVSRSWNWPCRSPTTTSSAPGPLGGEMRSSVGSALASLAQRRSSDSAAAWGSTACRRGASSNPARVGAYACCWQVQPLHCVHLMQRPGAAHREVSRRAGGGGGQSRRQPLGKRRIQRLQGHLQRLLPCHARSSEGRAGRWGREGNPGRALAEAPSCRRLYTGRMLLHGVDQMRTGAIGGADRPHDCCIGARSRPMPSHAA